jgi:tetratricopeptide (TPR) repeat protein
MSITRRGAMKMRYVQDRFAAAGGVPSPWGEGRVRGSGPDIAPFAGCFSVVIALLFLFLAPNSAQAQLPAGAFEAANKLYEEGKFSPAAAAYEKLTQSGQVSSAIYFNLGNALFKSSQIGRAIAAYRRAEQLAPRDPDIRANLQFARNQIQGPTLVPDRWQRLLGKLTLNEWTMFVSAAVWILFVMLALLQWRPALKPALRNGLLAVGLLTVLSGACLASAVYESRSFRTAIVVSPEVVVRYGPFDESQNAFTAHDGAELRVLDQKDDWFQVSPDPRRIGWLRKSHVVLASRGP